MTDINAALARRGIPPMRFTCGICGDEFDRDEYMTEILDGKNLAATKDRFGDVCLYCADDLHFCSVTGKAVTDGEVEVDEHGEVYADADVMANALEEYADCERHIDEERSLLRGGMG